MDSPRLSSRPPLLHRRSPHVFITTEDPEYRYEWICSHCGYPVTPEDACCPRCQRAIEECPVCSCVRHVRVPCVQPDAHGGRLCPSCGVRRVPFGDLALQHVDGTFCTNIYGCPAGGFLLRTDEYAVLPRDASVCPVCRDREFRPLAVPTFVYHVTHCLFCSTFYQSLSAWKPKWGTPPDILGELGQTVGLALDDCILCGRCDHLQAESAGSDAHAPRPRDPSELAQLQAGSAAANPPPARDGLVQVTWNSRRTDGIEAPRVASVNQYLRMAELARLLMLEPTTRSAFPRMFAAWFSSGVEPDFRDEGPAIHTVVELLLEGTRLAGPRRVLQKRITEFVDALKFHFPRGAAYPIHPQGKPRSFGARG